MYRIAIAEDNITYVNGLVALLSNHKDIHISFTARNGTELLQMLKTEPVDVILMDIEMPLTTGIEATKIIRTNYPHIRVIAITAHVKLTYMHEMVAAGAVAYMDKDTSFEQVLHTIRNVHKGSVRYNVTRQTQIPAPLLDLVNKEGYTPFPFTEKELTLMRGLCRGWSKTEIIKHANITSGQYQRIRESLLWKTGTKTNTGIVVYAVRNELD